MSSWEFTRQPETVSLPIGDWLLLLGWMSAHLSADDSEIIAGIIRGIGKQVRR